MASPLENSTLVEEHSLIRFQRAEGDKQANIYSRMIIMYAESCKNCENFYNLVEQFKNGRSSVTDKHRSRHISKKSHVD